MRFMNNDQRKAMFARFGHRMTNPYVVTPSNLDDIDGDGVPLALDINPMGNMALGTGLQVFGRSGSLNTGDRDLDGVNDMFDVNPNGSYAESIDRKMMINPPVIQTSKADFGDRLAAKMMRLYPNGKDSSPLAQRMRHFGDGFGGSIARLWPEPMRAGPSLEAKVAHLGDGLAYKISSLYPSSGSSREPLESRTARLGEGLAGGMARLWPG